MENELFTMPEDELRGVMEGLQDHELNDAISEASEFTETGEAGLDEKQYLDDPQAEGIRVRANLIVDTANEVLGDRQDSVIHIDIGG